MAEWFTNASRFGSDESSKRTGSNERLIRESDITVTVSGAVLRGCCGSAADMETLLIHRHWSCNFSEQTGRITHFHGCSPVTLTTPNMSKILKKKSHWTNRVHEIVLSRGPSGDLGFKLQGGAENGQFPVIGEVKPDRGKLHQDDLLLEVNDTPVAGLTIRDVWAVVKHCKDPVRLKCVKQC